MLLIVAVYCILWNLKPQSQIQYIAKFGVGRLVYLCTLFKSPDPNSETQVYCILWNLKPQSQIQYIAKFGVGRLVYLCTLFKSPDPNSETQKSKSSAQCAVATSDAPFFIMLTFKL